MSELIQALKEAVKDESFQPYSLPCIASEVTPVNITATPTNGDPEIPLVSLTSNQKEGTVFIPKEGSLVMVTFTSPVSGFVSMFSDIDIINLVSADSISIESKAIDFNGDSNGGLVIAPKLEQELAVMSARIDGIISAIENGVPAPTDGGAALLSSIKLSLSTIVQVEDFSTIENENITHG